MMLSFQGWQADFDERHPIYQQIISHFNRSLVKAEVVPGQRLPSIRDMAVLLKVNTNTIQRAYQEMERDGLIYSQRGTGYFVVNNGSIVEDVKVRMVRETAQRFLKEMRALGFDDKKIVDELSQILDEEKGGANHEAVDN